MEGMVRQKSILCSRPLPWIVGVMELQPLQNTTLLTQAERFLRSVPNPFN